MTQEDKELLLKDLCARLPYGVKVQVDSKHWCDFNSSVPSKLTFENSYRLLFVGINLGYVKPYLFPLSSMTEEQRYELHDLIHNLNVLAIKGEIGDWIVSSSEIDFYNKYHLDYRGLIPKGLALDATGLNIY